MKKFIIFLIFFLLNFNVYSDTYVKGYYRKDGTYVKGHYRSKKDNNPYNNWSTIGNTNPYTGKKGTINPNSLNKSLSYYNSYSTVEKNHSNNNFNSELYGTQILYSENDLWVGKITDVFNDTETCFISTDKRNNFIYWLFNNEEYLTFSDRFNSFDKYPVKKIKIRFDKEDTITYSFEKENEFNLIQDINESLKTKNTILYEANYNDHLYREIIDLSNFNKMYDIAKKCENSNYSKNLKNIIPQSIYSELKNLNSNILLYFIHKNPLILNLETLTLKEDFLNKFLKIEIEAEDNSKNDIEYSNYIKKNANKLFLEYKSRFNLINSEINSLKKKIELLNINKEYKNKIMDNLNISFNFYKNFIDDINNKNFKKPIQKNKLKNSKIEIYEYNSMIKNKILSNLKYKYNTIGVSCYINILQSNTGDILRVTTKDCIASEEFINSIKEATWKASPLPLPKKESLFSKSINLYFTIK